MAEYYRQREQNEESIYHWLPLVVDKPSRTPRPPRYISTFRSAVKREMQERKKAPCQTMGIPRLRVELPEDYLRKHSKEPKLPRCKRAQGLKQPRRGLGPPRYGDRPLMGIQSEKNYITANVAGAIVAVAKQPLRACVDQRTGEKFLVDSSGLVQKYLKKQDFGVTPKYIKKRKQEAQKVREEKASCLRKALQPKGLLCLSAEEREKVLTGLKENWEELNSEFQSLSIVMDTVPKKLHKEKLETEMKQLEHDIHLLEKQPFIYIAGE